MKKIRIGFVMDPIEKIHQDKDSTFIIMLEAQSRGWEILYMELNDLHLKNETARAWMRPVQLFNNPENWHDFAEGSFQELASLDIVFMRKDPPFDMEYIMATYILEQAEAKGTLVLNSPQGLRDANEKVFTSHFPQCCPPSLLTRSINLLVDFLHQHNKIVVKPTGKMGGRSVFVVQQGDPNTHVILEEITKNESLFVQAQKFIPEIKQGGDKRILLIDGEAVQHGIARIPRDEDHRGNISTGAQCEAITLTDRDKWICAEIGPELKRRGLFFVGIDIIGDYLSEINVTSPTGIREIDQLCGQNISSQIVDALLKKITNKIIPKDPL